MASTRTTASAELSVQEKAKTRAAKKAEQTLLDTLAELGGQQVADDDLVFEGRKLILPETMTIRSGIKFLQRRLEQEEEVTAFSRVFKYRPWDGAAAMQAALKRGFGTAGIGTAIQTMFGKIPPSLITIEVGFEQQAQVPWGRVEFPPLEAEMDLGTAEDPELGLLFRLHIQAPRKFRAHIEGLFKLIDDELRRNSIYKGKALNGAEHPGFIDPYSVDRSKVVYTEEVTRQLEANIWSLLRHTEITENAGLPLKRAVLLSGPYGTGKSLAAMLTAQEAVQNEWTFIQCRPGRDDLQRVMQTAMLYQPCVVFYEDVDTIAQSGDPEAVAKLLDMFDGIAVKGTKLVAVLTTNHADKIHKGMVRPGRLDAVVHIDALNGPAIEQLIRSMVPVDLLDPSADFEKIEGAMDGFLPSFIVESITRAVRYNISRTGGNPTLLSTEDFVDAANGLRPQLDLMNEAGEGTTPPNLETAMKNLVRDNMHEILPTTVIDRDATGVHFGTLALPAVAESNAK